jgi:hypothetical protein
VARRSRVGEEDSLGSHSTPSSGAARHLLPDGEKEKRASAQACIDPTLNPL